MNKNMKISRRGIKLITEFEGYHTRLPDGRCQAYLDKLATKPTWTIGYGCTTGVREGMVETHEENVARKMRELKVHEDNVRKWIKVPLNQNQWDACVSISYNVGMAPGRTTSLINAINDQDWKRAGDAFLLYNRAGGQVYRGLTRRRVAERKLFLEPVVEVKEAVDSSSKLTFLKRFRLFLGSAIPGGGVLDWLGYLEPVKTFITENWHFVLVGSVILFWLISKWIEFKSIEDIKDGRYTPSGLAANTPVDNSVTEVTNDDPVLENGSPKADGEEEGSNNG